MNSIFTRQLIMMSRAVFNVILVNCCLAGTLVASDSKGQTKSMEEINISVKANEKTLKEVLSRIEAKTAFHFSYYIDDVKGKKVTVNAQNESLANVLRAIAKQTKLGFKRIDKNINVLRLKNSGEPAVSEDINARNALIISVSGKVTTEDGEGIPGVNVVLKGTTIGSVTSVDGNYKIEVPGEDAVLVFSSVGYITEEIVVGSRSVINISMVPDLTALEEVVVIGYGVVQKSELTGSVVQVKGKNLENIPASRVDQMLQGRAAGVQVSQISGEPGAGTSIRIRGGNSIQGNNEPLWVIDGVIVGQDFNLNNINTNDIKSIDVLKDAVAVSIYGTRGANGVVLVTTKNGAGLISGDLNVSLNMYSGVQSMVTSVDFLDGQQHAEYSNDDAAFRGAALPFSDPGNVPNVDWLDQATEAAPIYNIDLSISGASENQKVNYYISGNYFDQKGIVRASGITKYIFRANLDNKLSNLVKTGFRINVARIEQENNKVNVANNLFRTGIASRAIFDNNGEFTNQNPVSGSTARNPEADIQLRLDQGNTTNVLGNIYIELTPSEKLIFRTTFSPELNSFKRNQFNPGALPENLIENAGGDARVLSRSSVGYINENTVTYTSNIGTESKITALGGFTIQKFRLEESVSQAFEFSNDVTGFNNLGFGSNPNRNVVDSDFDGFQLLSWLGRVNYSFKNKYLFTVVGRVDGSSRFAPGNKYAFFPSAAFAWRLSEEGFIENLEIFDNLKLRVSYGLSGSQAIESFRTLAVLDNANNTFNGVEQAGVILGRPANPELKWETTKQFDLGLEASFFKGRLSFELDYYLKKTKDLLLNVQIPRQTGFVSKLQNLGEIQNSGIELAVNSVNVSKDDLKWSTTFSISRNRNEVLDLAGVDFINLVDPSSTGQGGPGGRLIVGESAPVFIGVNYLGTWKSQEEIDASGLGGDHDVGGPRFEDTNGDNQINEDDFIVLGSPQPNFYFGLGNTISYKNWDLDFFFQGTSGNEVFNSLTQTAFFGRSENTKYAETINRWSPENPTSDIPRAGAVSALSEIPSNSKQIEDGSHIRLKSLKLVYNLPVQKMGLNSFKKLSVYFSGSNLFILSEFRLKDPETSMFGRDNLASGFSQGEYPTSRVLSLGVKAVF